MDREQQSPRKSPAARRHDGQVNFSVFETAPLPCGTAFNELNFNARVTMPVSRHKWREQGCHHLWRRGNSQRPGLATLQSARMLDQQFGISQELAASLQQLFAL
jgi:hypothetical protein